MESGKDAAVEAVNKLLRDRGFTKADRGRIRCAILEHFDDEGDRVELQRWIFLKDAGRYMVVQVSQAALDLLLERAIPDSNTPEDVFREAHWVSSRKPECTLADLVAIGEAGFTEGV